MLLRPILPCLCLVACADKAADDSAPADPPFETADTGPHDTGGTHSTGDTADSSRDSHDTGAVDSGDSGRDSDDTGESGRSDDSGSDSGDSGPDSDDSGSDSGDSGPDSGDSGPDSGDSGSDSGDSGSDAVDSSLESGDSGPDSGPRDSDPGRDTGTPDTGDPRHDSVVDTAGRDTADPGADSGDPWPADTAGSDTSGPESGNDSDHGDDSAPHDTAERDPGHDTGAASRDSADTAGADPTGDPADTSPPRHDTGSPDTARDDTARTNDDSAAPDSTPDPDDSPDTASPTADSADTVDADGDGWTGAAGDCDDDDPAVNPDAVEVCGNGRDDDCDGDPGPCAASGDVSLSDADATVEGLGGLRALSTLVTGPGDLDGDGRDDLAVFSTYRWEGAVFLTAPSGVVSETAGDVQLADGRPTGGVGDVDGDGLAELAVMDPTAASTAGAVYLYVLPSAGTLTASDATVTILGDVSGQAVSGAQSLGDVDGDGLGDLLVSASGDDSFDYAAGAAYVLPGSAAVGTVHTATATATVQGEAAFHYLSGAVSPGDIDGDGVDEVAALTTIASAYAGVAYVFTTLPTGTVSAGDADVVVRGSRAGGVGSLARVGDLDGDGLADLYLGSPPYGGYAFLAPASGTYAETDATVTFVGDPGAYAGYSAGDCDVDADGNPDLLIGDYGLDGGARDSGGAWLLLGPFASGSYTISAEATLTLLGIAMADYSGSPVGCPGDVDGDGYDDVTVASRYAGGTAGAVYLYTAFPGW